MTATDPQKRLVHVYTGDGKGKTCTAMGMAARALGRGWRVLAIQFLKPADGSGEILFLRGAERFKAIQFGTTDFIFRDRMDPEVKRIAEEGMATAEKEVHSGEWDMVILDEILQAADFGLLAADRVRRLMEQKPDSVELVLTGRNAPETLIENADLVSEIREIKHPHGRGIKARKGIEF
jgi:cob(I)alamin adenosyltransferase